MNTWPRESAPTRVFGPLYHRVEIPVELLVGEVGADVDDDVVVEMPRHDLADAGGRRRRFRLLRARHLTRI